MSFVWLNNMAFPRTPTPEKKVKQFKDGVVIVVNDLKYAELTSN